MANLSDFVTVNITVGGANAQVPSFSVPLVAAYLTAAEQTATGMVERVRYYSSAKGLLDDGFTVNSAAYRAIVPFFSQTPSVNKVALGRLANAPDLQVDLTPVVANSRVYSVDVLGPTGVSETVSFTSDATATLAEIITGLVSAINGGTSGLVATNLTTFVRVKASTPGMHFAVSPNVVSFAVLSAKQTHADPGLAADLAAIASEKNDWYTLSLATQGSAEIQAAAAYCLSNSKIGVFSSQDGDMLTNTAGNVGLVIKSANNNRAMVRFGNRAGFEHPAQALLGTILVKDPGSVVAKFRQPLGVTADPLTDTHIVNLRLSNIQFGTTFGGVTFDGDGKVANGEFFDVIRDRDWAVADMQAAIANVMLANAKLPFDDTGIACIVSGVRSSLARGQQAGVWASGWSISAPKAADVSVANKAARKLTPVNFSATLAGSIFSTVINGTVSI